ncbi:MAG TPA: SAM-dependent chlorinase/fluorinase [Dictyobacter sp.]|nr:SAM-dependent chlorinase/fluorinase [Dictyobacter sp.]
MSQTKFSNHSYSAVIALLTDFGLRDGYVGVMKGVMAGIYADVQMIDITHEVPAQDIATGAWVLATSYRYFPAGTIFLCVVDPGVGSQRRPIVLHAGDWFFVGPDNGLFSYILAEQPLHKAVALTNASYRLSQVSTTFQGRDLFSPVAAHIARGVELAQLGSEITPATLQRFAVDVRGTLAEYIEAQVVHIDHFGNVITNIVQELVPDFLQGPELQLQIPVRNITITERRRYFADAGERSTARSLPFLYIDSSGYIGVALQNASVAAHLGIQVGDRCLLSYR